MATLALTFNDLYDRVSQFLGTYGSSGPSGTNLTDAKQIVNDAYTKFITAREWTFLKPSATLVTLTNQHIYELPEDFSAMLTNMQYDAAKHYPDITECGIDKLQSYRATNTWSRYPDLFAIRPQKHDNTVGQRWEIVFYPTPDSSYTLHYRYRTLVDKLENDTDIPVGGVEHAQLIRQMAIAEGELAKDKKLGPQSAVAAQMLGAAIKEDAARAPHVLGYNGVGHGDTAWEIARGSYRLNNVNYTTD